VFAALGRVVIRHPIRVIHAWVVISVAVVAFSPRLTDIINADQTAPQAVSPNRQVQLVTVALQGTPQDEAVVAALGEVRQRSSVCSC
jgi:hypothetical protein